jgi:hypothetical protein
VKLKIELSLIADGNLTPEMETLLTHLECGPRCPLDGWLLKIHPKCLACGLLLGPAHGRAGMDGLCDSCRRFRSTAAM